MPISQMRKLRLGGGGGDDRHTACEDKIFWFSGPMCAHSQLAWQGPLQLGPGHPGILLLASWVAELCVCVRPPQASHEEQQRTGTVHVCFANCQERLAQVGTWQEASLVGEAGHVEGRNAWQGLASLLTPARREKLDFGVTRASILVPACSRASRWKAKSLCVPLWVMGTMVASSDLRQEDRGRV